MERWPTSCAGPGIRTPRVFSPAFRAARHPRACCLRSRELCRPPISSPTGAGSRVDAHTLPRRAGNPRNWPRCPPRITRAADLLRASNCQGWRREGLWIPRLASVWRMLRRARMPQIAKLRRKGCEPLCGPLNECVDMAQQLVWIIDRDEVANIPQDMYWHVAFGRQLVIAPREFAAGDAVFP